MRLTSVVLANTYNRSMWSKLLGPPPPALLAIATQHSIAISPVIDALKQRYYESDFNDI